MDSHNPYPDEGEDMLRVRAMVGDQMAEAYMWLVAYTANLNDRISQHYENGYSHHEISLDELITIGMSHVDSSDGWGEYLTRGGTFEGEHLDETFWDKLAALKQIEIPHGCRQNFFGCSC